MMHPGPPSTPAEDSDLAAAELIEELASRLQAGEAVNLEQCARQHPACAERIRRLLPAVQMLAALGRSPAETRANGVGEPLPGVLGDFRLFREVGRGGMGVVYEAEQISLRRRVALKMLPFAAMLDPRQLQRFHNEARAAACLHHPNIVPVHAVGSDRGVHFYAMQFIDGQTLASLIQGLRQQAGMEGRGTGRATQGGRVTAAALRSGRWPPAPTAGADPERTTPYPPAHPAPASASTAQVAAAGASTVRGARAPAYFRRVAQLGVQAAQALEHAHQQGVIHRDIKPANILLDPRGNLWITDFGLAHFQTDAGMTGSGDLLGTLRYMSPEHARGGRRVVDHRVDIYSLGTTLYELLTLEPAFRGDDRQELLRQITSDEPRPVRRLDPSVPAELETIVAKAMAKGPDERYATAQELADDLERFLEDRPIRARRPSLWQQGRKWARRNRPYVWSLGLFVALALLGSVTGALIYAFQEGRLAREKSQLAEQRAEQEKRELEETKPELFDALLGRVDGAELRRTPGYRQEVWKDLHQAVDLHLANRSPDLIRDRVVACLGDPIGLDPVNSPTAARAGRPEVPEAIRKELEKSGGPQAASADGKRLAFVDPRCRPVLNLLTDGRAPAFWTCPLGGIYDLEFTPDGRTLVAGCEEGVVIWDMLDLPTVPLLLRSQFRRGNTTSIAIHPGGRLLATAGRQLELWSLDAHRRIASLPAPNPGTQVAFSQDGKLLLAVVSDRVVRGWPVTETPEKHFLQSRQGGVPTVAFSPDGRLLASGSKDGTARIWDVASRRLLHTCRAPHLAQVPTVDFPLTVEGVAFSPDGRWLATGDFQGEVRLWDTASGRVAAQGDNTVPAIPRPALWMLPPLVGLALAQAKDGRTAPGSVWRLQFSPSGNYLAAGGMNGVAVWKVRADEGWARLERVGTAVPPEDIPLVHDLAMHPAEAELVLLSGQGKLYVAALEGNAEPRPLDRPAAVQLRSLHFDAAGERLTFLTRGWTLGLLDWRAGTSFDTGVKAYQVGLGGGGRWIATSSPAHEVVLYDVPARRVFMTLPAEESEVWSLAWSPDANRVAIGMADGGIAIWDLEQVRQRLAEFGITVPSTTSVVRP